MKEIEKIKVCVIISLIFGLMILYAISLVSAIDYRLIENSTSVNTNTGIRSMGQVFQIGTTGENRTWEFSKFSLNLVGLTGSPVGCRFFLMGLNSTNAPNESNILSLNYTDCSEIVAGVNNIFMPSYTLLKGGKYFVGMNVSGVDANIDFYYSKTNPYLGGDLWTSPGGFNNFTLIIGNDTTFEVFGLYSYNITENSQTFNATTYPSSLESFVINITYDDSYYSSASATLNYNGTNYLGTKITSGNDTLFWKNITIPTTVSGGQVFYWTIALTNSSGINYFNSTNKTQTISTIAFSRCNAAYPNPILVNFTIRDETDTDKLINATMKATFLYSLDSSYSKNYSLETEANSTFQFCSNINDTFNIKSTIQLNANDYFQRTYDLIENYSNLTTQKSLYLIPSTNGTNIIIEVKNSGNQPLPNYYVDIYRYYPETDVYSPIVSSKTDLYGQFSARLVENTVKYKFVFKDEDGVIVKTSEGITINCRATICVLSFIIEDTTDFFTQFKEPDDYDWSFTFNNNTNIFTFSWNDVSGVSATNRLYVEKWAINGTNIICNYSSILTSGSLTCDVGSSSASYQAQVFRKIGDVETRISTLSVVVGHTARDIFGKEGLIWCFFLFMTLISFGIYKPPVGIVLYLLGVVVMSLFIPITYINGGILIAEFVIGIIFIVFFKG